MRVYLVGFMGSGKTTVGRLLGRDLEIPFVDLDSVIERRAGMTVREIFVTAGEARFRSLEHDALRETGELGEAVVATGGGSFTFPRNQELLSRLGVTVFLHPSFGTIARRLGGVEKEDRPLFESETEALTLYRKRLPAYHQADLTVKIGDDETPEETAARIALRLEA